MHLLLMAVMFATADSTFELQLGRHIKPSDKYLWTTSIETIEQIRMRAASGPGTDSTMHLRINISAMVEVASITAEGEEHEKLLTIRNCTIEHNGRRVDLVPTGSLIRAIFTEKGTQLTLNNKRMPDSVYQYLGSAIRAEGGDKTKRILDAGKAVALRQTWPMNTKALLSLIDKSVVIVNPKSFKGIVTFEALDTVRGEPVATVIGTATANKLTFPALKGAPIQHSMFDITASVRVPLDRRYPEIGNASGVTMGFDTKITGPDGTPITYSWSVRRTQTSTFER